MKNTSLSDKRSRLGLSIPEILICIMIIAIMGSMVTGLFGGDNHDNIESSRDRRNAQTIATIASGAVACGIPVVEDSDDVRTSIDKLVHGQIVTTGVFKGKTFRISALTSDEIAGAVRYLKLEGDLLVYTANG